MRSAVKAPQCFALVHGDMIGLIALDLVLRIILTRMMDIAFVVHVSRVHLYDMAADPASFGIPGYMVADFECMRHELMLLHLMLLFTAFNYASTTQLCLKTAAFCHFFYLLDLDALNTPCEIWRLDQIGE